MSGLGKEDLGIDCEMTEGIERVWGQEDVDIYGVKCLWWRCRGENGNQSVMWIEGRKSRVGVGSREGVLYK